MEQLYRQLIGLRRRHPWLVDAVIGTEQVAYARIVVRSRARHGDESLLLALNLADEPLPLPAGGQVLEAGPAQPDGAVPPHGWAFLTG